MKQSSQETLLEAALQIIRRAASGSPYASQAELARATGESEANISRWLSGATTPTLRKLEPVLMALGARLTLPSDGPLAVPPVVVRHAASARPLDDEAFTAVPIVGEVGAGHGVLPLEVPPEEWVVVRTAEAAPAMWAVRVGRGERSMLPRIRPGDVVLVDTTCMERLRDEDVYLVQEPPAEGSGYLLKRVCLEREHGRDLVVFYSDNAGEGYRPLFYDLALYPEQRLADAVKGRVTHVWSRLY